MRLVDFIPANVDRIEREWEEFARALTPFASGLSAATLRNDIRSILRIIAENMEAPQSAAEQSEKSKGKAEPDALDRISEVHARIRLESGFDVGHVISEYRALRASI